MLVTHRWCGPTEVVDKEKHKVFVSYRGRVRKTAECLRKKSVTKQINKQGYHNGREQCSEMRMMKNTFPGKIPSPTNLVNFREAK